MAVLIFLDIDGVLHHQDGGEVLWSECIERVNKITVSCNAHIVITSSWRMYHDWRKFNDMFKGCVIGATPAIQESKAYKRYWEVIAWRNENNHSETLWLAIDDLREMYPPLAPIHLIDGEVAITDNDVSTIIERIKSGDILDRTTVSKDGIIVDSIERKMSWLGKLLRKN